MRSQKSLTKSRMNSKIEQSKAAVSPGDLVKYVAAVGLLVAGLFAFYWFDGQWPSIARVLVLVAGLVGGVVVFMLSNKGGQTREFLSEARFELRKVVWPTRQEATRTTWVVIAVVILLSLILAFFDVVIQAAVKWLLAR
jgi:preprotein translocase subunit SecE